MYTKDMKRAFHSIAPPKNFSLELIDNDTFITIKLSERSFLNFTHDEKIEAVQYVTRVKKALEQNGAIILVVRDALK